MNLVICSGCGQSLGTRSSGAIYPHRCEPPRPQRTYKREYMRKFKHWRQTAAYRRRRHDSTPAAASPTFADLKWCAGFLEGEGSFNLQRVGSPRVAATQKDPEPLHEFQRLLGGTIHRSKRGLYVWAAVGTRARGIMLTLYGFLSTRRRSQIRQALGGARQ